MSLILIVEDNEKNMKLVRDILRVKGYQTLEATTAQRAVCIAREHLPDLILMDIQLPGMSGIDALEILRADPVTSAIRVVAITASVMPHDTQRIVRAGFDGFIEKPINLRRFLATVEQVIHAGEA